MAGPWRLTPLSGGTNNRVWIAEAADGQMFVLRLIHDVSMLPRLRFEIALLRLLAAQHLPFALPVPVKARDGDDLVILDNGAGIAVLCPFLPGMPPVRENIAQAEAAGHALAKLDATLANLPNIPSPPGYQPLPMFGELAQWHPLVPDPLAAIERLPFDEHERQQMQHILASLSARIPTLYAHLPRQLLHRDFDPGNILMREDRVSAVFDFEFAGHDLRIIDLCVALTWWPIAVLGTGREWSIVDAIGAAYVADWPLTREELEALPDALRLRDITSLVHRMGRYLAGQETDEHMQARIRHSLWWHNWIHENEEALLSHAMNWA